jgi:hypothetical protein
MTIPTNPRTGEHQPLTSEEVQRTQEADPNLWAMQVLVEKLNVFSEETRGETTNLSHKRLIDTEMLEGLGVRLDRARLLSDVHECFAPVATLIRQPGVSAYMEELLPVPEEGEEPQHRTEATRYVLGGDVELHVDTMLTAEGEPTWVRISASREPSSVPAPAQQAE